MPRTFTAVFVAAALLCSTGLFAQQTGSSEEQEYTFALGLFKDGHYQLAYQQFTDFTTHFPASNVAVDAEYYAAECQYQMGGLTDAALGFERFVTRHPDSKLADDAGFRHAEVLYRQGRHADAHTAFADVLRRWPEGNLAHEAAYWAGESAFQDGNYPLALRYYTISHDHYPQGRIRDYALFSIGYVHEKTGRYTEARAIYDSLLRAHPASALCVNARTRTAACLHLEGDDAGALSWLESLTDAPDAGNVAERLYLRGECAYALGRYADAERRYRDYIGAYPDGARVRQVKYSLGWACVEQKKYSEAIAVFDELGLGSDGVAEASRYRKGMALRLAGNLADARQVFQSMLAQAPLGDYADNAHFELGMAAFHEGAWTSALASFHEVTARFPQSDVLADAWNMTGEVQLKLGKPAEAATAFTRALDVPNADEKVRAVSRFRLGWSLYQAGAYDRAIPAFEDFLRSHPLDSRKSEALVWLGESHFKLEHWSDAEIVYNQALVSTEDPTLRQDALYGLAWSLSRQQKFQEAEQVFRRLSTEYRGGRHDMDANIRLGDAQFAMKRFSDAAKTYRYAWRMYPNHALAPYALLQLGNAEHRAGDTPGGIATLKTMLSRYPTSEYADKATYSLAWLHFQNRDFPTAIGLLDSLIVRWPASTLQADAKYTIGDCLYNQGRYADAERAYRRVLDEHPDSPLTGDALDGIGQCLRMQKKDTEAAAVKEEWLAAHPRSTVADVIALANARKNVEEGNLEAASAALESFVRTYPDSPKRGEALLLLAHVYRDKGETDRARATYTGITTSMPASADAVEARVQLAEMALAAGNPADAASIYTALIASPDAASRVAELHYRRGLARRAEQNVREARSDFARAAENSGSETATLALIELAALDAADGRIDTALATLATLAATHDDDAGAQAQYTAGRILSDAGRSNDAEKALLRVEYIHPNASVWIARSKLLLGGIYEQRGDVDAARTSYQKLVDRFGGSPEAEEAAKRLARSK